MREREIERERERERETERERQTERDKQRESYKALGHGARLGAQFGAWGMGMGHFFLSLCAILLDYA